MSKKDTFRKIKQKALVIVILVICGGYFANAYSTFSNTTLNQLQSPIFAQTSIQSQYKIEFYENFASDQTSLSVIDQRIEEMAIDPAKVKKIENYLNGRNAPLADEAETFVRIAAKYDLPYHIMPAISVIESSGGKYNYRPYNYAGMGGQSNAFIFDNYEQAIEKHAQILKFGYYDKGADTPEEIEQYYCYQCPTWGEKVGFVMQQIENS